VVLEDDAGGRGANRLDVFLDPQRVEHVEAVGRQVQEEASLVFGLRPPLVDDRVDPGAL
jgi:hypothetical protein